MKDAERRCVKVECQREVLTEIEVEKSWTTRKYYCPKCEREYGFITTIGKVAQVSSIVTASLFAANIALSLLDVDGVDIDSSALDSD